MTSREQFIKALIEASKFKLSEESKTWLEQQPIGSIKDINLESEVNLNVMHVIAEFNLTTQDRFMRILAPEVIATLLQGKTDTRSKGLFARMAFNNEKPAGWSAKRGTIWGYADPKQLFLTKATCYSGVLPLLKYFQAKLESNAFDSTCKEKFAEFSRLIQILKTGTFEQFKQALAQAKTFSSVFSNEYVSFRKALANLTQGEEFQRAKASFQKFSEEHPENIVLLELAKREQAEHTISIITSIKANYEKEKAEKRNVNATASSSSSAAASSSSSSMFSQQQKVPAVASSSSSSIQGNDGCRHIGNMEL